MIQAMVLKLQQAAEAYYNQNPIMTDMEFDTLEEELRKLDPNNPYFLSVGANPNSGWTKVALPFTMGSLNKAQTLSELEIWVGFQQTSEKVVSEKLDGISISLVYQDGVLIQACTRGNGVIGEDITNNVRKMKGVPLTLPDKTSRKIRGEILLLKEDFKQHFPDGSNPRNSAAGAAKAHKGDNCHHLTVMCYNIHESGIPRSEEMHLLSYLGFQTPLWMRTPLLEDVASLYNRFIESVRGDRPYEIDGLVVEVDDPKIRAGLGVSPNGLNPVGSVALKFPHDMRETILRDIVWQTGASGRITPVAIFDEVPLAGAVVTRATLHNLGYIETVAPTGVTIGDPIQVSRRNDVIPAVEAVLATHTPPIPTVSVSHCPTCGAETQRDGAYVICPAITTCPAQVEGGILQWLSKTGVLHFGEALVAALVRSGMVKSIPDLYTLDPQAVADLEVGGRKIGGQSRRAFESLQENKTLELSTFLGSLGIPLCGRSVFRMVTDAGYSSLEEVLEATPSQLCLVGGIGDVKAKAMYRGLQERRPIIQKLLDVGVAIKAPKVFGTSMVGVSVCFTGVRDAALEAQLLENGGEVKSGVSKGLTYLVCKDPESTSSKMVKARQLGVQVVSLEAMREIVFR